MENSWNFSTYGFHCPTENPCVMRRENLKSKSCGYIVIYQADLYIAKTTPEEILHILKDKYKLKSYMSVLIYFSITNFLQI